MSKPVAVILLVALVLLPIWILYSGWKKEKATAKDRKDKEGQYEEHGMWANIGGKCKALAAALCWLGIIGCIIYGIFLIIQGSDIRNGESLVIAGIAVAVLGSFMSYLGSIGLYAIGEAAEKSAYVAKYIEKLEAAKKEKENKAE